MAYDQEEAVNDAITNALSGPKRVRGDAGEVESHSVKDLIEIDKYYSGKAAAARPFRGLRITRLLPGGTE